MHRRDSIVLTCACLALLSLAGCATTNISSSWVAPDARPVTFDHTLVVFMHPVENMRRTA